jgi:hypothetical protein
MLEHPIDVRSVPGRGSMFAVEVPRGAIRPKPQNELSKYRPGEGRPWKQPWC